MLQRVGRVVGCLANYSDQPGRLAVAGGRGCCCWGEARREGEGGGEGDMAQEGADMEQGRGERCWCQPAGRELQNKGPPEASVWMRGSVPWTVKATSEWRRARRLSDCQGAGRKEASDWACQPRPLSWISRQEQYERPAYSCAVVLRWPFA